MDRREDSGILPSVEGTYDLTYESYVNICPVGQFARTKL